MLFVILFTVLASGTASALTMDDTGFFDSPTVVDFESGFPTGGFASQTIGDAVFSSTNGASTLFIRDDLLSSGNSLIEITGSMTIDFLNSAERVGFEYQAGTPLYFEAYDAAGTLLNSGDTFGLTGMGFLGFESATAIASVIIHDTGATLRVDSLRYDVASVPIPEPKAAVLFSVGLLAATSAIRRRNPTR
jgi:hypothetical protein